MRRGSVRRGCRRALPINTLIPLCFLSLLYCSWLRFRMSEQRGGRSEYFLDSYCVAVLSHNCSPFLSLRFMASITRMLKMRSSFTKYLESDSVKRPHGPFPSKIEDALQRAATNLKLLGDFMLMPVSPADRCYCSLICGCCGAGYFSQGLFRDGRRAVSSPITLRHRNKEGMT